MLEAIDVVVRCRDEMPHVQRTLAGLSRQAPVAARILFIDCGSTDGSRAEASAGALAIVDVERSAYVPGAVINLGMERTRSDLVAFVNADAVPIGSEALARLVAPLAASASVAASFGRQLPRPDASAQTRADHARTFGPAAVVRVRHGRFFSMAACAIRRSVWERLRFDESLRYSEDVDWVERASALGWACAYAPDARFEKSRDYDLAGHFARRAGEGEADTAIHHLGSPSPIRELLRPLAGALLRDASDRILSVRGVAVRCAQAFGYFAGRVRGCE